MTVTSDRKRILFVNCCPHTSVEEKFWKDVRDALAEASIDFLMYHSGNPDTDLPMIRQFTSLSPPFPSNSLRETYTRRVLDWKQSPLQCSFDKDQSTLQDLLFLTQPDLVLIWNGEQPRDALLKTLLQSASCPFLIAERTPWPGMISLDQRGILSNCSFYSDPIEWESNSEKSFWEGVFSEYESEIVSLKKTWWQQPKTTTCQNSNLANLPTLLFAGQVDGDTQNFLFSPHFLGNLDAFKWIVQQVNDEEFFILGKHHPKSDIPADAYRKFIPEQKGEWREDLPLEIAIHAASCVVAVNSSLLCEALIHRKPAFALGQTPLTKSGAIDELQNPSQKEQLKEWLKSVIETGPRLPKHKESLWITFSSYHFSRNLYSINASTTLEELRGPKKVALKLRQKIETSHRPKWQNIFTSSFLISFQNAIQAIQVENENLNKSLSNLQAEHNTFLKRQWRRIVARFRSVYHLVRDR